jgi:hypothetical protein
MSDAWLTRRAAAASLASLAALAILPARAQPRPAPISRFRAIQIDLAPLRSSGDRASADVLAKELPGFLAHYFAPYLAPADRRAPILRARIDSVSYGVEGSVSGPFNTTMDYIDGAAVVVGAGGRPVATYPITSSVIAHPDLTDVTGWSARQRMINLAQSYAQWLPGKMGL